MAKTPPFPSQQDFDRLEGTVAQLDPLLSQRGVLIRELQGKVAELEAQASKGGLIAVQRKLGTGVGAYSASLTAVVNPLSDGSGGSMQIAFTPPVDCWWEVNAAIGLLQKQDAAYHPAYGGIGLGGGVDALDSAATGCTVRLTQHSTVDTDAFRSMAFIFALTAGVPYYANLYISPAGGTWRYYISPTVLWIHGKAYTR